MKPPDKFRSRNYLWWLIVAIVTITLLALLGWDSEHLLLGWIYFPLRTLPRMTVDWLAVGIGVGSLALFVVLLHYTVSWFAANATLAVERKNWRWRSSLAIAGTCLLLFAAGISLVGMAHQLVWLQTGRAKETPGEPVLGVIGGLRDNSRQIVERVNVREPVLGMSTFHDHFQVLPPGGTMTEDGELLHGWATFSAFGMNFIPEGIDYSIPWNKPPNDRLFQCNLEIFVNPALAGPYFDDHGYGYSHLAGNIHVLPIRKIPAGKLPAQADVTHVLSALAESGQKLSLADISDGRSNTFYVGTVRENFKPWGHPANVRDPGRGINTSPDGFGGPAGWHGAEFSFCDGSVRHINEKIDPRVLRQLATPNGNESGTADELLGPK